MMSRRYLESLGTTDEELVRRLHEVNGTTVDLDGEDSEAVQRRREDAFTQLSIADLGSSKVLRVPTMGSFANDNPEEHERSRNKGGS